MLFFLLLCSVLSGVLWMYKKDNRTIHNIYSSYGSLFKELDEYGILIKSYFQSIFTFTLISLLLSLFGFPSNVLYNGDFSFFYALSFINLLGFAIVGLRKNGFKKLFASFFVSTGNSIALLPLNLFISTLLFLMTYVVKPIVLPSRIALNGLIGETMHHAIINVPNGEVFAFVITGVKLIIYFIQAYMFYMFSFDLFKHLYHAK